MKILVTGSSGFIGSHLCPKLIQQGHELQTISRAIFSETFRSSNWSNILQEIDCIIHLAARAHTTKNNVTDPLEFHHSNTLPTIKLAQQAADKNVRRFIFISSIKVNGEGKDGPYTEQDASAPIGAYAISKHETEQGLRELAANAGMEIVILRPPLVYGPGVKANFQRLLRWSSKGIPLPIGAIENRRSLLYIGNLISAIELCTHHPAAANQTFLVSDNQLISTPKLLKKLALHAERKLFLPKVPIDIFRLILQVTGNGQDANRLSSSLVIDNKKIRQMLNWQPPFTLDEGLAKTVSAFQGKNG